MKTKRAFHKEHIAAHHQKKESLQTEVHSSKRKLPASSDNDIKDTFTEVILPKKRKIDELYKQKRKIKDDEHFIPYLPSDKHTEEGYTIKILLKHYNIHFFFV